MDAEIDIQTGKCKACGRDSIVITRVPEEDESDGGASFCPYCGDKKDFSAEQEFGMAGYFLDDELATIGEIFELDCCASCGCSLLLAGDARKTVWLNFKIEDGPATSKLQESICFCSDCLEEKSQRELVQACAGALEKKRNRISSLNGKLPDLSVEAVADAFKTRKIV